MKILKIELQNINSLKADEPFVVDFESSRFKDIGLYAITGSTGAGKTTLLDAITVALYHSVPRFNNPGKASLEDIVSYGSDFAFSRITFANKSTTYEASWSMRLVAKNGKRLSKPDEITRIKDLTNEKILAEKKTEVRAIIEEICQLNYNQFLRSVMLAQGEFASFLSASAQDKGKLLEQITGEDIYRRIGETINGKIYDENKKLEAIKAKVNNEDLLNDEQRSLLKEELLELGQKEKTLEQQILANQKTIEWFKKDETYHVEKNKLSAELVQLDQVKASKKNTLNALSQHEKAAPFQKQIEELKRLKQELSEKYKREIEAKKTFSELALTIDVVAKTEIAEKEKYKISEATFNDWQPKLEQVSSFDTEIKNHLQNITNHQEIIHNQTNKLKKFAVIEKTIPNKIEEIDKQLKNLTTQIQNNTHLIALEPQLNVLNNQLHERNSLLKKEKEQLAQIAKAEQLLIGVKKENVNINTQLTNIKQQFEEKTILINELSEKLKNNPLEKLLLQKEKFNNTLIKLSKAEDLMEQFHELTALQLKLGNEQTSSQELLATNISLLNNYNEKLALTAQSVTDAEKILKQELLLVKYDAEREKLSKNEPCPLCGSKDHPFVTDYKQPVISETEKILEQRKVEYKILEKEQQELLIAVEKSKNKIESIAAQMKDVIEKSNNNQVAYKQLDLSISVTEQTQLKTKIQSLKDTVIENDAAIQMHQNITEQYNKLREEQKQHTEQINKIINKEAALVEQEKHLILTINDCNTESNRAKQNQEQITTSISQILKDSKLNTPDNENYLSFIENISQQINNYHQNTKKHIEIKGQKDGLSIELANTKKQISEEQLLKEKIENELIKINQAVDLVKTQRTKLLPLNFSTETKRKALQTQLSEAKTAFDNASVKHNNLLQEKASLQNSINQLGKEIQSNTESQKLLENELNQAITNTSFHTIEEISSALLSHDNEVIAKEIKARIEAQKIKLDTLKEQLEENRVNLDQIKPMDTSFEKAKEAYLLFETTKSKILKRQGEISKQFELDNQIIARNKGVYNEMLEQKDMVNKWTTLMNVLGGSKHAFNTYVQRLTLQQLIQLANKHLFNLNKRYSLKLDEKYKKGEELSFKLVDHYQTDQLRYVDTSSGGEKFLISLSLALGLSDLASNNVNIDSLFIDEGFGTLDSKTLDIVISSLETLQAQGKMIGIISHVENLKERIPTQIQVIKKSNGVSRIEIV